MAYSYLFLSLVLVLTSASSVSARSKRVNQIPNGSVNRCANCHVSASGGGARNSFGNAINGGFLTASGNAGNVVWNSSIASMDSDGDGFTNGEELGDPNGTGSPISGAQVTNPGDANSKPEVVQNRAPVLASIPNATVKEGETLTFLVEATDEDNDQIVYAASGLPSGGSLSDNSFSWVPDFEQGGNTFDITFTASDGEEEVSQAVQIVVENVDREVEITSADPGRTTVLGMPEETITFSIVAEDPDGEAVTYVWIANGIEQAETGSSFILAVTTGEADDEVLVTASSGENSVAQMQWSVAKMLLGDFTGDNTVNFFDFIEFTVVFNKVLGDAEYDPKFDLSPDDRIDFFDFLVFIRFFDLSV